jgi:hypothetical protein
VLNLLLTLILLSGASVKRRKQRRLAYENESSRKEAREIFPPLRNDALLVQVDHGTVCLLASILCVFFFFFFFDISHGYASQDKVTLGTLDVTTLTLDVRPHELTLILRGSKRGKEKEWLLMGPNEFVLLSWHNAIVNAQNPQQSDVRASLLGTYLHSPPTPRAEELPVGMAHSEEETLLGSPEGQYHILLQQGTSKFFFFFFC